MPLAPKKDELNTQNIISSISDEMHVHEWTLSVAESCTGGGVAYSITAVPGVSEWFEGGYVTYCDQAKNRVLGVSNTLLKDYGAVSQPVAIAMAEGALDKSYADLTLSITGIAGPEGGSDDKPVGLVWFAWSHRNWQTSSDKKVFKGNRRKVRKKAIRFALDGLLFYIRAHQEHR